MANGGSSVRDAAAAAAHVVYGYAAVCGGRRHRAAPRAGVGVGLIPLSGWFPKDRQALHLMTADELRELVRLAGDYAIEAAAVGDAYGKQAATERRNLAELAYRAKCDELPRDRK